MKENSINVTFSLTGLTANIPLTDWFLRNGAKLKDTGVEAMSTTELAAFVATLTPDQLKDLIRLAFYEGSAPDQEALSNWPRAKITDIHVIQP